MLVGSSLIRDIDERKLTNTKVLCCRGAHITDLTSKVQDLKDDDKFDRAVLVGGGNDCSSLDADVSSLLDNYRYLIEVTKAKAYDVTVSSVCPRGEEDAQQNIDALNAGLQGLCSDLGCHYKDNTSFLTLSDGSINEGYFVSDKVHLTYKGQSKLAQNLGLVAHALPNGHYDVLKSNPSRSGERQTRANRQPYVQQPAEEDTLVLNRTSQGPDE